jgi:hypothetical protein
MKNDMYASGKESRMCHEKRGKNNVSKTTAVYVDGYMIQQQMGAG